MEVLRSLTRGQTFEGGPRLQDLYRLGLRNETDARAAMRFALDQPLVLQAHERGTHGRARHPELAAHLRLHEPLVRGELAAHDRLAQPEVTRRPRLLLLDELSLGLAPLIVERLLPVVREFALETGCGVLLVEQHIQLALTVADHGYVLSHGGIAMHDRAQALRDNRDLLMASYFGEQAGASQRE